MHMCMPWCLIRVSSVLGVGVVMHVLHLPDDKCVMLIGAARGVCVEELGEASTGCFSIEGVVI